MSYSLFDRQNKLKFNYIFSLFIIFTCSIVSLFSPLISAADTDSIGIIIPRISGVTFYRVDASSQKTLINTTLSDRQISFLSSETLNLKAEIDDNKYYSGLDPSDRESVASAFSVSGDLVLESCDFDQSDSTWDLKIAGSATSGSSNQLSVNLKQRKDLVIEFPDFAGIQFTDLDGTALKNTIKNVKSGQSMEFTAKITDTQSIDTQNNAIDFIVGSNNVTTTYTGANDLYNVKIDKIETSGRVELADMLSINFTDIQGLSYKIQGSNDNVTGKTKLVKLGSKLVFTITIDSKVPVLSGTDIVFNVGNNSLTQTRSGNTYTLTINAVASNASVSSGDLLKLSFPTCKDIISFQYSNNTNVNTSHGYLTVMQGADITIKANFLASSPLKDASVQFSAGVNGITTSGSGSSRTITVSKMTSDAQLALNYSLLTFPAAEGVTFYKTKRDEQGNIDVDTNAVIPNGYKAAVENFTNYIFYMGIDKDKIFTESGADISGFIYAGNHNVVISSTDRESIYKVSVNSVRSDAEITTAGSKEITFPNTIRGMTFFKPVDNGTGIASGASLSGTVKVMKGSRYQFLACVSKNLFPNKKENEYEIQFFFGEQDEVTVKKYYEENNNIYYLVEVKVNEGGVLSTKDGHTIYFPTISGVNFYYNSAFSDSANNKVLLAGRSSGTFYVRFSEGTSVENPKITAGANAVSIRSLGAKDFEVTVGPMTEDCEIGIGMVNISFPRIGGASFGGNSNEFVKTLPYGTKFTINASLNGTTLKITNPDIVSFSAGSNALTSSYSGQSGANFNYTLNITCSEDATVSVGKILTFPTIYNVKFYDGEVTGSGASLNLSQIGSEIGGGASKSFVTGANASFVLEVDSSVNIPHKNISGLFYAGSQQGNAVFNGEKNGKLYYTVSFGTITQNLQVISKNLFTLEMPTLPDVYYYETKSSDGSFSDQLKDKKVTLYGGQGQTLNYVFFTHFDDSLKYPPNNLPNITSPNNNDLTIATLKQSGYTQVTVSRITANTTLNINVSKTKVSVIMPEQQPYLDFVKYSLNKGSSYSDDVTNSVLNNTIDYGSPMMLKISFKGNVEGYNNLYKTLVSTVKVKVYSASSLENGDSVSDKGILLDTLSINALNSDSGKFITAGEEYVSEIFYPTTDVIVVIEGITADFYDLNIVAGDNKFEDELAERISGILKIFKVDPNTKEETEVNFVAANDGYVVRNVSYGDSVKFKCVFTDGAQDLGIKYNFSELTLTQSPPQGDSDVLDKDADDLYTSLVKDETTVRISGIKINVYTVKIPASPSVNVEYVLNRNDDDMEDAVWTKAQKEISVTHGQRLSMRMSSNDAVKQYIKTVTATDTTHNSEPQVIYNGKDGSGVAQETLIRANIEKVLGDTELGIVVSKKEYQLNFSLRGQDDAGKEVLSFPDPQKLMIYDNTTVNANYDGQATFAPYVLTERSNLVFRVVPDYKYDRSDLTVSYRTSSQGDSGASSMIVPKDGIYTLSSVSKDGDIIIDGLEINKYSVDFPQTSDEINFHRVTVENGATVESPVAMIGPQTVTHGETMEFVPKITPGYALNGIAVKANGEPLRLMDGKYKLANISEDITVTAEPLDKLEYTLSFPSNIEGVSFLDTLGMGITTVTAPFKSSYSFKLSIDPKYNLSTDYATVYAVPEGTDWQAPDYDPNAFGSGAIKLEKDGASNYTLSDISQNMIIIVRNVTINQFYIDLPVNEEGVIFTVVKKGEDGVDVSYEVTNDNKRAVSIANYGENFVFSAKAKEGYDISEMNLNAVITESGYETPIEKMSNGYIIQNVTNEMTVNASMIKRAKHTVNLKGDNIVFRESLNSAETITSMQIDHEEGEIEFALSPENGYFFGEEGVSVSVEPYLGAEVTIPRLTSESSLDGLVKVKNVVQDVDLVFSGANSQTFTVTLPVDTEGVSFMKVDGETSSQTDFEWQEKNTVFIGTDFKFYIKPHPGYDISNMTVSTGPGEYLYPSDGIYTIENVTKDVKVEVANISYSLYTVKLRGENMTFYEPNGLFAQNDFNAPYKGGFQFRISPDTGYEIDLENGVEFFVGNKQIVIGDETADGIRISKPDQNGVFTVSNVESDTVVNVDGSKKQKYKINLPTNLIGVKLKTPEGDVFNSLNSTVEVEYLGEFRFEVIPEFGYNTEYLYVTIDPPENGIVRNVDGGYVIESVVGNINVLIEGINANEYEISYKGTGANFYTPSGSQITLGTAKFKESFSFSIEAQEGFDLTKGYRLTLINEKGDEGSIEFKVGEAASTRVSLRDGTSMESSGRFTYTVSNVQGSLTILVDSVGRNAYTISLPTSVKGIAFYSADPGGGEITGGEVLHGDTFRFKIAALDGYDISNIFVTANANTVELIDGEYTISHITENIKVEVTGVVSTRVYLNLKYVSGVVFKDVNDNELSTLERIAVEHGKSYSFKVDLESSYSQSKDKLKVTTNFGDENLSYTRGIYTLSNITEDTDILVSNVELNVYNITLSEGVGIIYMDEYGTTQISGVQQVNYGGNFRFMVNPQEGFTLDDIEVSVKGGTDERIQLSPVDGVYTVTDVTADYTVVVENAQKELYTVEIRISNGAALLDEAGKALPSQVTVKHGDNLSFRMSLDTAYSKSSPVVTVKGRSDPILPQNNIYTVTNITSNIILEVSDVTKNTYKVNFKEIEGVIYKTEKKKEFKGALEVEYGGTLAFIVDLADEYDASQFTVLLDGDKTLAANGGIYQVTNVGADCEISVKYVTRNTEEDVIDIILDLPNKVSNSEDAAKVVSATRAYNDLPEDRKELVTNISKLRILQTQAGDIHHESSDVQVTGIDWNIKVLVVPQEKDSAACERLNQKMERKTVISAYEISLYDSLSGKKYEVPKGQKVSVVIPFEISKGYSNAVIVHEKESGSIEYLDMLVSNNYAKFETESFSLFGVAAKLIPNYVEDVTNVTISLAGLTDNEEETKKQILADELPSLMEEAQLAPTTSQTNFKNNVDDPANRNFFKEALSWMLAHEFLITSTVILMFILIIALIIYKDRQSRKKN